MLTISATRLSADDCQAMSFSVSQNSFQLDASWFAAKATTARMAIHRATSRSLAFVDFGCFFAAGASHSGTSTVVIGFSIS
jgi:hypothetical protein